MHIIIYELIEVLSIGDYRSLGLYFRSKTVARVAKEHAKSLGYKKVKGKLQWGDVDDYGMLRGLYIAERKVEE